MPMKSDFHILTMTVSREHHNEIVRKLEEELQSVKKELQLVKEKLQQYEVSF